MSSKTHEIRIGFANSESAGGCNGCTNHVSASGSIPHRVLQVELRGLSFRLCRDCLSNLMRQVRGYAGAWL